MLFYVKPGVDITWYGFQPSAREGLWFWFRKTKHQGYQGAVNMSFNESDRRLTFQSMSSDCVATVCEMYKNGDVEIIDESRLVNLQLTTEEAEMVTFMRQHKREIKDMMKFWDEVGLAELDLSVRAYNCLTNAGVTTVSQFMKMSESELKNLPRVGKKTLKEYQSKRQQLSASKED